MVEVLTRMGRSLAGEEQCVGGWEELLYTMELAAGQEVSKHIVS